MYTTVYSFQSMKLHMRSGRPSTLNLYERMHTESSAALCSNVLLLLLLLLNLTSMWFGGSNYCSTSPVCLAKVSSLNVYATRPNAPRAH